MERRQFVKNISLGVCSVGSLSLVFSACSTGNKSSVLSNGSVDFSEPSDQLLLADDLEYQLLIKELDPINDQMTFGSDNAGIVFLPESDDEGYLWINHESVSPVLASGYDESKARHRDMIRTEMFRVGGTIVKIRKKKGRWVSVRNDIDNYRVTGASKVPLNWGEPIENFNSVVGTVANRGSCKTPWGTILSAERDYDHFYGEYDFESEQRSAGALEWQSFFPKHHPHLFGWIVEVDPTTGSAKKHIGMGRMFHGDVALKTLSDGQLVVYSCDDRGDGSLYKFVSDTPNNFDSGKLFVANFENEAWELLDISRPELSEKFESQTDLLIRTPLAAKLVDGSPLDSPSGLAIHPENGDLVLSIRGRKSKGAIVRIIDSGDQVKLEEIISAGESFAHPSAMAFGPDGRLWFGSSLPIPRMGKGEYQSFFSNGLFVLDIPSRELPIQMASAPKEAEFAGMDFTEDGETMFLSVQHPGTQTKKLSELTSNWPGGGTTVPLSAVVAVSGDALNKMINPT